jgi:hypothetical protein
MKSRLISAAAAPGCAKLPGMANAIDELTREQVTDSLAADYKPGDVFIVRGKFYFQRHTLALAGGGTGLWLTGDGFCCNSRYIADLIFGVEE